MKKPFPATWLGWQSGFGVAPDVALWNLTSDIPGHNTGSTVSSQTLEAAGYALPGHPASPSSQQARREAFHRTRRSMDTANPFGPVTA